MTLPAWLLALLLIMSASCPGFAVNPDEVLQDVALEARARTIGAELRCLVCQNQSIDDSNSGLARDLRIIVRERLTAGDSDEQVIGFVVQRFGNFVLLKPPFEAATYVLWLGPALVLLSAFAVYFFGLKREAHAVVQPAEPLNAIERDRLKQLENEI
jgi:cytochrome c-type biogenesis protein CcmH